MDKDIEILTAFLLANIPEIITQEEFDEVKQAIENLIKRNKYLEEKMDTAIEMLEEKIKYCKQEAEGSLNNEICHIALKFYKSLLNKLKECE